ncbi:MAG: hypothetical protein KKD44_19590 [Proteobacteria bacterium]|nr:hypothetical protein [Pseudomonadota bacterium]
MSEQSAAPQHIIVSSPKSMGISLILTFLFGPLGMLYSTILGGIIMMVVTFVVGLITLGFGVLITWPICMIWGAIAVSSSNKQLMAQVAR